jgi:hypothetical protein
MIGRFAAGQSWGPRNEALCNTGRTAAVPHSVPQCLSAFLS